MASQKQQFLANIPEKYAKYSPNYAWRLYRLESQGFSRSQARGHARTHKGEVSVRTKRVIERAIASTTKVYKRVGRSHEIYSFRLSELDTMYRAMSQRDLRKKARGIMAIINYPGSDGSPMQINSNIWSIHDAKALQNEIEKLLRKYEIRNLSTAGKESVSIELHFITELPGN